MERLPTTDIPGWIHSSLQGEVITNEGVPTDDLLSDTRTPAVIRLEHAANHEPSEIELFRVSPHHGRSYELGPNSDRTQNRLGRVAVWHDEFSNNYTSYSLKGNNFTHSTIMESMTAPSGYIPMGLLESDALLRVVRSSRLLREAGVSTEWINRVFEPQELIYRGETVSQSEYKSRLLTDTANERGLEEMMKIAAAIEPMTFFITGRSMEINDRLADFRRDTPEQAKQRLQRVFAVYNATHTEDENFKRLQPARESDRGRFFKEIYPTLVGANLAKLHNADYVHTFPNLSNVTILGGMIDLDSIRGVPLDMGDSPITASDRANDVATFINDDDPSLNLNSVYAKLHRKGLVPTPWDYMHAERNLIDAYTAIRKPLPLKKDRLIETIAISGANWRNAGNDALNAYKNLSVREAGRTLNIIWTNLREMIAEGWSDENMAKSARGAIDTRLEEISKDMAENSQIELSKELLAPAFDFMTLDAEKIDLGLLYMFPVFVEFLDNRNNFTKLRTYIPDKAARLRVLRGITESISPIVSQEILDEVGKDTVRQELVDIFNKEVESFLDALKPEDWQVLPHAYEAFKVTQGVSAERMLVLNQKAVHGFDNIDFTALINSTLDSNIPIITDGQNNHFDDRYLYPPQGHKGRTAFSDGSNYKLGRLRLTDIERDTVCAYYQNSDQDINYFAWLCESEADNSIVMYIDSNDNNRIDTLIARHKTTQSKHTAL